MSRLEYHVRHADWSSLVVVLSVLFALAAFAVASSQPALPGAGHALTAAVDAGWSPAVAPAHADRCATECGGDKCCTKCATVDRCCCKHKDFKCDCVKDPTRGER